MSNEAVTVTKGKPNWIHRRVEKCPCGHPACKDWHVAPEANLQGVKFTQEEATQVAILLDMMDRERDKPTATDAFVVDVSQQLTNAIAENLFARQKTLLKPNTIVMVRADLLSVAHLEIESLRKQLREKENQE